MRAACGAGDSVKPGVKRSGTTGIVMRRHQSLRSGRQPYIAANSVAHFAGWHRLWNINLGSRCAPPQALRYHLLRRLGGKKMPRESPRGIFVDPLQRALITSAEDAAKNAAGTSITTVSIAGVLPVTLVITLHKPLTESLRSRVLVPMRTLRAVALAATSIA